SDSPAWSPDGKWLYFLSDRNLRSLVSSPWGNYQPEPFLDKKTKLYHLPLVKGLRSPFAEPDELHPEKKPPEAKKDVKKPAPPVVKIDLDGLPGRLIPVPVKPGNYSDLWVNDKGLFWLSRAAGERTYALVGCAIARQDVEVKTVVENVRSFELSDDGKKLLVHKGQRLYVL